MADDTAYRAGLCGRLEHEVVQRAVAALADPNQATFTRAQVWYLIQLAMDYRDADEFQAGYDYANAELVDALTGAIWGSDAETFKQAREWHQRALTQRLAREAWDATARRHREGDHLGGPVRWDRLDVRELVGAR